MVYLASWSLVPRLDVIGAVGGLRGAGGPVQPRLRRPRGAGDGRVFVGRAVRPVTVGLNGVFCGDRDIKSFVFPLLSGRGGEPADTQALSQLLGPLPNVWQHREGGKEHKRMESPVGFAAESVSLRAACQTNRKTPI